LTKVQQLRGRNTYGRRFVGTSRVRGEEGDKINIEVLGKQRDAFLTLLFKKKRDKVYTDVNTGYF
jgi:hypothetical protein